jgi:hypothetical protein
MPHLPRTHLAFAVVASLGAAHAALPARAAEAEDDAALDAKLDPIIECMNHSDAHIQRGIADYLKLLAQIEKDANTSHIAFLSGFEDMDFHHEKALACADMFEHAQSAPPELGALDRMIGDYAAAFRAFAPLSIDADAYYKQEDYKDDKWAKGRALNQELAPLLAKLETLSADTHREIGRQVTARNERELAAIERQEGKGFNWHTLNYMLAAHALLETVTEERRDDVAPAIERLQKGFEDATAFATAHEAELEVKPGRRLPGRVFVRAAAQSYLANAKEMRRALAADGKPSDSLLHTKFESLVNAYNSLVDDFNRRNDH